MSQDRQEKRPKSPTVRQTMGFLFAVIAGNFVSDYMKDAYEVIHHDWTLSNMAILIGGAVFIMKQISDCFLYYQDFAHYESETFIVSSTDYVLFFFDNSIEFAVLLFAFGGAYEFKNVDANRQITTHALGRFLSAAALTELCWLLWDLSFIGRSIRHQLGASLYQKFQALIRSSDAAVRATWRWTILNFLWSLCFGFYWTSLNWDLSAVEPKEAYKVSALLAFYAISYGVLLRNYYSGSMYPATDSSILVPNRSAREAAEAEEYLPKIVTPERAANLRYRVMRRPPPLH